MLYFVEFSSSFTSPPSLDNTTASYIQCLNRILTSMAPNTPILVGIGEVREKKVDPDHTTEPSGMMLAAIRQAAADASISITDLEAGTDNLAVVPPWTWAYPNLPATLTEQLHIKPAFTSLGEHGGEQCALLTDDAARLISIGRSKLAIVTGGESLASLAACHKAGKVPPPGWSEPDPAAKEVSTNNLEFNGKSMFVVASW